MFLYHLLSQKKQKYFFTLIPFLCFVLLSFFSHAKKTQQIITPHFSILFDKSATDAAKRIANTLETIYQPVSKTLGVYPSPIRLVINNQSTEFNAYFKPLPRHIYFNTLYHPNPYFIGNEDWLNMISTHEFRHAVQHSIEYYSTPFWLRPLYFGCNLIAVCDVNPFFKEGDAVGIETALSKSGRGRLPGWEKIYKVNLLEGNTISFSRQIFGSLKHEVPDMYHIGYYFTTHIRRKYGAHAIQSIFEKSVRGIPYFGFYNAVKQVTKKSILKVYEDMNNELLLNWQKQLEGLKITPATQLTIKKPDDSFNYMHPFVDTSGNLMAWKSGIGLRDQLVQVGIAPFEHTRSKNTFSSLRKDKTILYFIPSGLPPAAFAIGDGSAAWLETCKHPWQGNKQTIRLQYYDFKEKKRRTLVASSRYIALAMSPNTQQLIAVTSDETGKHFLVVLDTKSGKVVKKINNPDKGYYLTPSWSGEDHIIVVKTKDQQNSILRINITTSKEEILLPYTYEHRSYPRVYKDYLLYNSSYNGIDNIYAMHLPTKACFQITSRKYGAYLGMVDPISNQLVFNDYTKNGMDIAVMPFDPLLWKPLGEVTDRSVRYYEPLVAQEQNSDILAKVPNHEYPIIKHHFFHKHFDLLGPNIEEPNWRDRGVKIIPFQLVDLEDKINIAPFFYQNFNILNKAKESRYKTSELGLKIKYATFYPIFDIDIKGSRYKAQYRPRYCIELKDAYKPGTVESSMPSCYRLRYTRLDHTSNTYWTPALKLGIKLPYYFTLGSSSGEAYFKFAIHLERLNKDEKISHTKEYTFHIAHSSTFSKRDISPPWHQELYISFKDANNHTSLLKGSENIFDFSPQFYTPGIGNHHYFRLRPTIQRYKALHTNKPQWEQFIYLQYGFPLVYPECGIPLIWFLEKIWMEGYCNIGKPVFTNITNLNTIGTKFYLQSRFLSNRNIPYAVVSIDFPFCKKQNDRWAFQFPVPIFDLTFHLEAKKEVEFTKKNKM